MYNDIKPMTAMLIFVLITSLGQTLFASILLLTSRQGNRAANRYLSACMLLFSFSLGVIFVSDFWVVHLPHGILTFQPVALLLAPLIWLYVKKLTHESVKIPPVSHLVHGLPALIVVLLYAPFYSLPGIEKTEWLMNQWGWKQLVMGDVQKWTAFVSTPVSFFATIIALPYFFQSYKLLVRHKSSIENTFSNTDYISLGWLKYLIFSCATIWILGLTHTVLFTFDIFIPYSTFSIIITGSVLLTIFGYFGINQIAIYQRVENLAANKTSPVVSNDLAFELGVSVSGEEKYKNSNLSEDEASAIHEHLLEYMSNAEPFLNAELTINQLAEQTHISARDLSRVINEVCGKNFMEFINEYRIERAKHRLCHDENESVLDVAMNVGFNSKSAFYVAFKRVTNTTPTNYRKEFAKAYRDQLARDKSLV